MALQQSIHWSDTAVDIITHTSSLTNDDLAGVVSEFSCRELVLSASDDKTIRLWNSEVGDELMKFEGHTLATVNEIVHAEGMLAMIATAQAIIVNVFIIKTDKRTNEDRERSEEQAAFLFREA
eukprot:gene5336-2422_t